MKAPLHSLKATHLFSFVQITPQESEAMKQDLSTGSPSWRVETRIIAHFRVRLIVKGPDNTGDSKPLIKDWEGARAAGCSSA
jgi:hypothetical protein